MESAVGHDDAGAPRARTRVGLRSRAAADDWAMVLGAPNHLKVGARLAGSKPMEATPKNAARPKRRRVIRSSD
jgi:hypothetical protein